MCLDGRFWAVAVEVITSGSQGREIPQLLQEYTARQSANTLATLTISTDRWRQVISDARVISAQILV